MDVAFISGILSFEVIFFNLWQQSWLINCLCFTKLRRVYRCNAWLFWWHRIRFSGTCVQQGQSRQLSCVILVIFSGNLEIRDTSIEKWQGRGRAKAKEFWFEKCGEFVLVLSRNLFLGKFCGCRQRDRLEDMLRDLTPERIKISRCMVFCVDHADCAEEVN